MPFRRPGVTSAQAGPSVAWPTTCAGAIWVTRGCSRDRLGIGAPQEPVLDHGAHRAFLDLGGVEMQHPAAQRPANPGARRRPGSSGSAAPRAPSRPTAQAPAARRHRAQRQRIGATVEIRARPASWRARLDQRDVRPGIGERQGQRRAVEPAPDDQNIRVTFHRGVSGAGGAIVHRKAAISLRRNGGGGMAIIHPTGKRGGTGPGNRGGRGRSGGAGRGLFWRGSPRIPLGCTHLCPLTAGARIAEARPRPAGPARGGLGPLDGVPISWKDLFDTAGVATEAGSALLRAGCRAGRSRAAQCGRAGTCLPGQDPSFRTGLFGARLQPGDRNRALYR
jgi:hypothetical protein